MISCCLTVKEEYLGNNLYISEYDNIDRRILYSEEECTGSGNEIVPMTVVALDFDNKWIIAKSTSYRTRANIQYWIVKNDFMDMPDAALIKANTIRFSDSITFENNLKDRGINLKLRAIE